ncbi:DUF4926 domain-containing protein [Acidithiobacillus ferriphilus]|uniref:DUF4926 domain-containing protein n=1 Tax=Acidithiobacillus ferriphilus TaxID=1689834 RepID=UPI00232E4209|nr:DUF4926 domain-containing protein [Acidithiobacillus ferriphilus]WCE95207.1 DUF4926 domain-containing protein [Acidithiobacillus ferriphilus]
MKILDVVALLEPIPEQHLLRSQIGTVVEALDPGHVEVEFLVGDDYITSAVAEDRLMLLHYAPNIKYSHGMI